MSEQATDPAAPPSLLAPDVPEAKPAVPFPAPARPPLTVDAPGTDTERAVLDGVLSNPAPKLDRQARRLLKVTNPLGRFVAARMLEKPDTRASELLHHRAKVAFVDGAAALVPIFFDEVGRKSPNKTRIDACLAGMRGAGIVVDSVPVSASDREAQMAEDRKAASMTNDELQARINDRMDRMRRAKLGTGSAA